MEVLEIKHEIRSMVTDTDSFDRHQQTNKYYHATITLIPKLNEDIKNKNIDPHTQDMFIIL